jgi:hypothetical protein
MEWIFPHRFISSVQKKESETSEMVAVEMAHHNGIDRSRVNASVLQQKRRRRPALEQEAASTVSAKDG